MHHYLRVTITGQRVEVSGVRADGTTIETTSWTEPRRKTATTPAVAAGGAAMSAAPAPVRGSQQGPTPVLWFALVGMLAVLGAAMVVVRTMRR